LLQDQDGQALMQTVRLHGKEKQRRQVSFATAYFMQFRQYRY
jgi:hypothetical protein